MTLVYCVYCVYWSTGLLVWVAWVRNGRPEARHHGGVRIRIQILHNPRMRAIEAGHRLTRLFLGGYHGITGITNSINITCNSGTGGCPGHCATGRGP